MSDTPTAVRMKQGQIGPVFGSDSANTGTLTIQASPAPTCTLYDFTTGLAVQGFSNVAVTGYDAAAAATVRAWYDLDTTNLPFGLYVLTFKFAVAAADAIPRTSEPNVMVDVVPPWA